MYNKPTHSKKSNVILLYPSVAKPCKTLPKQRSSTTAVEKG